MDNFKSLGIVSIVIVFIFLGIWGLVKISKESDNKKIILKSSGCKVEYINPKYASDLDSIFSFCFEWVIPLINDLKDCNIKVDYIWMPHFSYYEYGDTISIKIKNKHVINLVDTNITIYKYK